MANPVALRVLVVEDEALISMLLEDMLAGMGHTVVGPASTLTQALDIAAGNAGEIDVALLDVKLQGVSCFPVAEYLKARDVPFVFTTGSDETDWVDAPKAPILTKPYSDEDLAAVLTRAMARVI